MTTRFADHLLDGTHAARPAATAVPAGTLYSCTDHALVYQSDGATWATWATLGTTETLAAALVDAKGDLIAATAADTPARLAVGTNGHSPHRRQRPKRPGIKWAASRRRQRRLTLLSTTTLASPGTIDVSQHQRQLQRPRSSSRSLRGTDAASSDNLRVYINNDSGSNYYDQPLPGHRQRHQPDQQRVRRVRVLPTVDHARRHRRSPTRSWPSK